MKNEPKDDRDQNTIEKQPKRYFDEDLQREVVSEQSANVAPQGNQIVPKKDEEGEGDSRSKKKGTN